MQAKEQGARAQKAREKVGDLQRKPVCTETKGHMAQDQGEPEIEGRVGLTCLHSS